MNRLTELIASGSLEMFPREAASARAASELFAPGTRVYVPFLPNQPLDALLDTACALRAAAFEPVPHLAARRIDSRQSLRRFLQHAVRDAGVQRLMLVAGDVPEPLGPYADSLALLRDGALAEAGVREIGIAGYPDGHPRIGQKALDEAFAAKLALACAQGLRIHVVTQFSFAPARIVEYCASLARRAPCVPVYAGIVGPTGLLTLLKYAQRCGVSVSLRALRGLGLNAAKLAQHADPTAQIAALAGINGHPPPANIVGVHLFTFGGFLRSAQWVNAALAEGGRSLRQRA